ncbi:MAG: hypothetical protein BVN35_09185 [Proteobacteria bacterium ST_bin11]|nr:MAG: hypothetical protein BVN35_09185 [Proteobacteria bacterium ST_bin11]
MSYFLWIEDFSSQTGGEDIACNVLGGIIEPEKLLGDKKKLRSVLKSEGVFIELNFGNGLDFIQNRLSDIDFIILDMNLPAYSGSLPNANVVKILEKWHGYKSTDGVDETLLSQSTKELQDIAGYHLYTQLIFKLGFPEKNILFCSNHGSDLTSIKSAFIDAKIELPIIYTKDSADDKEKVQAWVKNCYENPYSRLRRGIIEGCKLAKTLSPESLSFNDYVSHQDAIKHDDIISYLEILENFLPLREPENKQAIYKLFVRTISHEWDVADTKKIRNLAWIMKNVRNWVTHNSSLFSNVDEKLLAYLFIINMRLMFGFDSEVQSYENILFALFPNVLKEQLFKDKAKNDLLKPDIAKAYLNLKNMVLDEKIKDGFYFNELANSIQQSNSSLKNDIQLFSTLLYQMFWLVTSYPEVGTINSKKTLEIKFKDFKYLEKPYIEALARYIYHLSFPQGK